MASMDRQQVLYGIRKIGGLHFRRALIISCIVGDARQLCGKAPKILQGSGIIPLLIVDDSQNQARQRPFGFPGMNLGIRLYRGAASRPRGLAVCARNDA